jgi:ABC-2 type transport system permease protein
MNFYRTTAIAKKEFKHLIRDYRMLIVLLLFPAFLLGVFGYAITFDVQHIKMMVYDLDKSETSREFINTLSQSSYFDLENHLTKDSQIKEVLDNKLTQCVLVIPKDFSKNIFSKKESKIQCIMDGVEANTASIIQMYINSAVRTFQNQLSAKVLALYGQKSYIPVALEPQFWYNPDLKTSKFLVPGLIAMILIITAAVSVCLSLVKEKEKETIEQIKVSSIKTSELLIGKSTPYVLLSFLNAAGILFVGYLLFDVVVKGDYFLLFICTFIFIVASTSIGILVSVISNSQQIAFSIAIMITLLPSFLLSGFVFPIDSMPVIVQIITNITPTKFFITILRAIILRGVGISAFWDQLLYLILFSSVLLGLAILIHNKQAKKI